MFDEEGGVMKAVEAAIILEARGLPIFAAWVRRKIWLEVIADGFSNPRKDWNIEINNDRVWFRRKGFKKPLFSVATKHLHLVTNARFDPYLPYIEAVGCSPHPELEKAGNLLNEAGIGIRPKWMPSNAAMAIKFLLKGE